jgi:uncharacterized protein YjbJ (UPF0337 family)
VQIDHWQSLAAFYFRRAQSRARMKGFVMDKDRIKGTAEQVKGSIKEAVGKITGNDKLEVEGKADKLAGKAQAKVGEAKDAVRDAVEK